MSTQRYSESEFDENLEEESEKSETKTMNIEHGEFEIKDEDDEFFMEYVEYCSSD